MFVTHSYIGTSRRGLRCLFFLLFEDYLEAQRGLSAELTTELERFARNLGDKGAVVLPFAGDVPATQQSIRDKRWPHESVELLQNTPAMLMIGTDFDDFDPRYHSWVLFHFGRGTRQEPSKFRSLMEKVVEAVDDETKSPFQVVQMAIRDGHLEDAYGSVELKPGVWGVSVDLRKAWKSFKDFLRSSASHGPTTE